MTDYKYIKSNSFILKRCEKEAKQRAVVIRSVVPNADGDQPWELWEPTGCTARLPRAGQVVGG